MHDTQDRGVGVGINNCFCLSIIVVLRSMCICFNT
jgi:hypothetical protein